MEDRRHSLSHAAAIWPLRWLLLLTLFGFGFVDCAAAASLEDRIPGLFGGVLATSITPTDVVDAQRPLVADRFKSLSASLAAARSQVPVPSASGAFRFEWENDIDTFVRSDQSLGSILAERAPTLGRGVLTVGVSYSHADFSSLEGDRLNRLRSSQPALSPAFIGELPTASDRARVADDTLETRLKLEFEMDVLFFAAAFGVTDTIDVSLAVSVNRVHIAASADAVIQDLDGDGGSFFTATQPGVITTASNSLCSVPFRCAHDEFDESAAGTGDVYLRGKWNLANSRLADLSVAGVLSLPTGNADDFLGFHDASFTPWLIASQEFDAFAPHLNLGYSFRSSRDVSQAVWIAGTDYKAFEWLTLNADFLGYHDDHRDGINDDVIQCGLGFKLNPWRELTLGASFQLPVNEDGLRADVIYMGQAEYTLW